MNPPWSAQSHLRDALGHLGPHDHLCSIYDSQEEQFAVAIPFIRIGLERNEKCVYIADDHNFDDVMQAMHASGIDVEAETGKGALSVITKRQAYMKTGRFDPNWMFSFWGEAADGAMAEGFSSLRATGETEWTQRAEPGIERWMEYESRLTQYLEHTNAFALCQYNRRVCPPEVILNVIRTHPIVISGDTVCRNFYFVPPEEFLKDPSEREVNRLLANIRDREHVEAALRRAHDELEIRVQERTADLTALNQELEAFSYSVSHDLRAPLRHIGGFAKLLAEQAKPRLAPDDSQLIDRIQERAQYMGRMIDDLMALSRVGRHELAREITDLRGLAREVIDELKPDLEGREVEFHVGELPFVDCDPVLIKQVFYNLLSNAVKFTRPRQPAVIEVGQATVAGRPAVFVRDNGVGFNMKYVHKLFGAFQRLHRREDFDGAGIGLATVQRIIHRHGGRVWAEAELNRGATFYFTLYAA